MKLLLDTHSFLWFAGGDERLSGDARRAIADMENTAYVSTASLWEMAIKINIGKLRLPLSLGALVREQVRENAFELLFSEIAHVETYVDLPLHHRDPFDRMIIAQAKVEGTRIVGKDQAFHQYDIDMLW
jgi:PIN domain nuclease of toxin-antitoxin system